MNTQIKKRKRDNDEFNTLGYEMYQQSAIIYCRASKNDKKINFQLQEETCVNFCHSNGYIITKIIRENSSGKDLTKLPMLKSILQNNRNTNVIIYGLDRMSRNLEDTDFIFENLEKNNIKLFFVSQSVCVKDQRDKELFKENMAFVQLRYEIDVERCCRNYDEYRIVPYGWWKNENGILEEHKTEQKVIRFICHTYGKIMTDYDFKKNFYKLVEYDIKFEENKIVKRISAEIIIDILNSFGCYYSPTQKWTKHLMIFTYDFNSIDLLMEETISKLD